MGLSGPKRTGSGTEDSGAGQANSAAAVLQNEMAGLKAQGQLLLRSESAAT